MSIQYINNYKPPASVALDPEVHLHTAPGDYDVNWLGGPVGPVSTDKLLLLPLIVSTLHVSC